MQKTILLSASCHKIAFALATVQVETFAKKEERRRFAPGSGEACSGKAESLGKKEEKACICTRPRCGDR